ncbi:hypothetical protein BDW71DRAFT_2667 [Aspergillus fruticulosus]
MRLGSVYLSSWPRPLFSAGHRNSHSSPQLLLPITTRPVAHKRFHQVYLQPGARFSSSASVLPASHTEPSPSPQYIEDLISSLPLTRYLRSSTQSTANQNPSPETPDRYTEFRPLRTMRPSARSTHLVATALISPTRLSIDPIYFLRRFPTTPQSQPQKTAEIIATAYLSTHLTGHAGYIHGGLLGILFDDAFARLAAEIFPSGIGMTANLSLDFRAPAVPGRVYVWRVGVGKVEKKRKVWVHGGMRCLDEFGVEEMWGTDVGDGIARDDGEGCGLSLEEKEGVLVAEAKGLFVEPRGAKGMVPLYPK